MTSSPVYPQLNGLAETGVHIVKRLIQEAVEDGEDLYLALLNYRMTPARSMQAAAVPISKARQMQKHCYDVGSKSLPPLAVNDHVRVRWANTHGLGRPGSWRKLVFAGAY